VIWIAAERRVHFAVRSSWLYEQLLLLTQLLSNLQYAAPCRPLSVSLELPSYHALLSEGIKLSDVLRRELANTRAENDVLRAKPRPGRDEAPAPVRIAAALATAASSEGPVT
jgi:hypothetical protein